MEKQNPEIIYHGSLHKIKQQQKMGLDDINTTVERLKALKKVIQCEMRKAYWSYVESIINPTDDQDSHTGRKRF